MDTTILLNALTKKNLCVVICFLLVLVSGMTISYVVYENRKFRNMLQTEKENLNLVRIQEGKLRLEYSTLVSPDRIEEQAQKELGMIVPDSEDMQVVFP